MKKLFLFCLVVSFAAVASAQKGYFLYLQTDDQAPFYVRFADKIYSSSTAGYVILPNLLDSTYMFGIGFAKSTQPETRFVVSINEGDKGYLIKRFTDGLSLFDLQELSLVKSVSAVKENVVYETKTDKFSSVLSKAADDPGLLKVPVAKKAEPKVEPAAKEPVLAKVEEPKTNMDGIIIAKPEPVSAGRDTVTADNTVSKTPSVVPIKDEAEQHESRPDTPPNTAGTGENKKSDRKEAVQDGGQPVDYKPSTVIRRSESSTTEGFGIVFIDKGERWTDTIRILIPPAKGKIDDEVQTASLSQIEKKQEANAVVLDQPAAVKTAPTTKAEEVKQIEKKQEVATVAMISCKEVASENDFRKLRKNMAGENTDEAMVEQAKKIFRNKCFSVEQIRYLSTLFLTSAAKYQFFDAAFNYVSDKANFSSLQGEIKDDYYIKRFKALVGE